jgi:hypothetical protein
MNMPRKKEVEAVEELVIQPPKIREMVVPIRGDRLLSNRMTEETKEELARRQAGLPPLPKKKERDPEEEWKDRLHVISWAENRFGFPAIALKKSLATAGADRTKYTQGKICGIIQVMSVPGTDLLEVLDSEPHMRTDWGVNHNARGAAIILFRPEFIDWRMDVRIRFDESMLGKAEVLNLFEHAGHSVGIGPWRPERKGEMGRFQIDRDRQVETNA